MQFTVSDASLDILRESAHPLSGARTDYDPLVDMIGDARFVLLGEASHGTHEFYKARAQITKRLIVEKGFTVIGWEADWPDALRVNRHIRGGSEDVTANEALADFKRFPTWMWRNADILDFSGWLRTHNSKAGRAPKAGVSKAVVWAHNSHIGDARATQMNERGELNVGQLVRERHASEAVLVGFTTYAGTVTAASDWGAPAERKRVRPGMRDSYEFLLHETGLPNFLLSIRGSRMLEEQLRPQHLERAIGVIYRPETERWSHYFHASLSAQFDAVIHFDETRAVEPLERPQQWEEGELAETYPTGL